MAQVNDLRAFLAVAREQSFTKAAAKLGLAPSDLSNTMRALEGRLGVHLLVRTPRSVTLTATGERLMHAIAPLFDRIATNEEAAEAARDKPRGVIRVTCTDEQIELCIRPKLAKFLEDYPEITLEFYVDDDVDDGCANAVEEPFDAGIRMGASTGKDMIAVRIGPDWRLAVVGSPAYFARHSVPETPDELIRHRCINLRPRRADPIHAWEFEKDGEPFTIETAGQLVFNRITHALDAAADGIGLAYVPEELAAPYLAGGRLEAALADWSPYFQGFHLCYPKGRQTSPAFAAFVEALKYPGPVGPGLENLYI